MKRFLLAAALALSLPACAVYKIDIQQGNEITAEMLGQLSIGMSKREVGKRLGFPLVTDPFHADRWDYYFYLKKGATGEVQQHSATLHFDGEALRRIDSALLDGVGDDDGGDTGEESFGGDGGEESFDGDDAGDESFDDGDDGEETGGDDGGDGDS
ncbi:MAG: outer membrane protein assembly factor BamE [Gammaproteobacteria bacterium]|nr:outer membrane protein assembly factor BamE [Gammaproteobacteria bacterium]